jgi:hypothetical protein
MKDLSLKRDERKKVKKDIDEVDTQMNKSVPS